MIYDDFHKTLAGGDMLTATRGRGSQRVRKCGQRWNFAEDWHCKGKQFLLLYETKTNMQVYVVCMAGLLVRYYKLQANSKGV